MAEFSPDLDDAELWLPADILRDVGYRGRHRHYLPPSPADLPNLGVEDLARQLFDHVHLAPAASVKTRPDISPRLQQRRPKLDGGRRELKTGRCYSFVGSLAPGAVASAADGGCWSSSSTGALQYGFLEKPVWTQTEAHAPERRGSWTMPPLSMRSWFVPVRSGQCGGTGVFLPRVFINSQAQKKPRRFPTSETSNSHNGDGRKEAEQQVLSWKQRMVPPMKQSHSTLLAKRNKHFDL